MKKLLTAVVLALATASFLVSLTARPASAATLTEVSGFGTNPSGLTMYVYVPDTLAAEPALLVAVHYCGGSAQALSSGGARDYVTAADRYGFVIVFPEATRDGRCFDVSTPQGLTRDGGSDSTGIAAMVRYAQQKYGTDRSRTYAIGMSSGAMMTNVLAAEYPDVFAATSVFAGVPASCFGTGSSSLWNSTCSGGNLIKTAAEWASAARAMYPGYTGSYPRMQLFHGTADDTLRYPNFGEEIKQWTALHGLSQTPAVTDHPQSNWTRTRYGATGTRATVEGNSFEGVGHNIPQAGMVQHSIDFLGLNGTASPAPSTTPAPAQPAPAQPAPAQPAPAQPAPAQPGGAYPVEWTQGPAARLDGRPKNGFDTP